MFMFGKNFKRKPERWGTKISVIKI